MLLEAPPWIGPCHGSRGVPPCFTVIAACIHACAHARATRAWCAVRPLPALACRRYVAADELIEVTPSAVRLRKLILDSSTRKSHARRLAQQQQSAGGRPLQ